MHLQRHPRTLLVLACFMAAALGILVYLPGLPGDFVLDDIGSIAQNPDFRFNHAEVPNVLQVLFSAPVGGLLRPLSTLTFMLDAWLFGISPAPFKITNILIHIGVGIALFLVAREILRAFARRSVRPPKDARIDWLALAATTLWLVHPINLTSVLYVVQRDNSLAALFTAVAIYAYLVGRHREVTGGGGTLLVLVTTPLLVLLGMLCKENAALTPVLLLTVELTILGGKGKDGAPSRLCRRFFLLFLLLPLVAACLLLAVKPAVFFAAYDVRPFSMGERMLTECRVLMDYLGWIVVPDLRQLGLFHDDFGVSRGLFTPPSTLLAVLAVLGLLAGGFALRRRAPLLALGVLWFFAGHLMESTILPLELVFEHRNYLPAFGLILAMVGTLGLADQVQPHRRLMRIALIVMVALLAAITTIRAHDWRSELAFARSEALHHPGSARAEAEEEWAYMNYILASHDTSLVRLAVSAAERSMAADPGSINQDVGLAYMYTQLKDLPSAQARLQDAALRGPRGSATATLQLALQTLLHMTGTAEQPLHSAIDAVFRSVLANPNVARNACYHSDVWNSYALFLSDTGKVPDSLAAFHQAVTLCPSLSLIHANFASALLRFGDTHDAEAEIEALDAQHDVRYLGESHRLHQEYTRLLAAQGQ